MTPSLHALPGLLLEASLRGSVLLLVALGVTHAMRRTPAAARHLVWMVALFGTLALPFLGAALPAWRVIPVPAMVADALPASATSSDVAPSSADAGSPSTAAPYTPSTPVAPVVLSGGGATEAGRPEASAPMDLRTALLGAWALVAAFLLLRLAVGVARVKRLERQSVEITEEGWTTMADGLSRRLGLGRLVRLLRAGGATVPMTWGVVRPVVLLPAGAGEWDEERRRVVLAHELAHVGRWDAATQWVAHLATCLFWFNPLVWVAARRLREEREHACDDAVIAIGARRADYADHLLDLVRSLGTSEGPAAALAMARRSQFEGRLLAILDAATPRGGVSRRAAAGTFAAAAVCLLPLAAVGAAERPASPVAARAAEAARTPKPSALAVVKNGFRMPSAEAARKTQAPSTDAARPDAPASAENETGRPSLPAAAANLAPAGEGVANVLPAAPPVPSLGRDPGYAALAKAAETIDSPAERAKVLVALLGRRDLGSDGLVAVLRATRSMSSPADRREVLTAAASRWSLENPAVRSAYLASVSGMGSSHEQASALRAVLARGGVSQTTLAAVLRATMLLSSCPERLTVHVAALRHRPRGEAFDAYVEAARSMTSEPERVEALRAIGAGRRAEPAARSGREVWNATTEEEHVHEGRDFRYTLRARQTVLSAAKDDVADLLPGGFFRVEETAPDGVRAVHVRRTAAGTLVRSWTVDGRERPYGPEARAWLRDVLHHYSFR